MNGIPFLSPEPKIYTLPEAAALLYRNKMSKRDYEGQRQEGKLRNFDVYPPYNKVKDFRRDFCQPSPDAMSISDTEVIVSLQAAADWQLAKQLGLESTDLQAKRKEFGLESREKVETLDRMAQLASQGYSFRHDLKHGCDGFNDNPEYKS